MKTALVDTNLLVLLVVGSTDRRYITTHKRMNEFTQEDYDILLNVLDDYQSFWITSHCLAEASNLLRLTHQSQAQQLMKTLAAICTASRESHISQADIFAGSYYLRVGVADAGFIQKAKTVTHSFTDDHDLYQIVSSLGYPISNFTHIRAQYLLR